MSLGPKRCFNEALAAEDQQVRLATHLLYYTAQRIGDVLRMRWSDIQDGKIHRDPEKDGPRHGDPASPGACG
jgi:integrase